MLHERGFLDMDMDMDMGDWGLGSGRGDWAWGLGFGREGMLGVGVEEGDERGCGRGREGQFELVP